MPEVWSSAGEVFAPRGQVVAQTGVYRVAFELDPGREDIIEMRVVLYVGRQAVGRDLAVPVEPMTTRQSASVPPFAELDMPEQNLRRYVRERRLARTSFKTLLARLVTFGGALALTVYATLEMIAVVSVGIVSILQWAMVALFAITFGWIALTAAAAVSGVLFGGVRRRAKRDLRVEQRTALVMPVYNENPAGTFAALLAMAEALLEEDAAGFEIFVLSDTTRPEIYVKETAAYHALREKLGDRMRVWYRRRSDNVGRKVGNLQDFVTQWGGRYDFMIVLDADSILAPDTLVTLVREMAADPNLGLLQTVPRLAGGKTLFARLQQFAGRVYGPIVARGMASWQGDDGNYWGHNAIIRVRAFAAAAGLPVLPGKKPFGGAILSHDFVEAALAAPRRLVGAHAADARRQLGGQPAVAARRAPRATGVGRKATSSISPSSGARGSRGRTACTWGIGVMSYLASPLWFALIVVGLGTAGHIATVQFEYFTRRAVVVPALAVVRQRANDPAVHHRDGDVADAEAARRAARAHRRRALAQGQSAARRARRGRRDDPLGVVRADHDDDAGSAGVRDHHRPGLRLDDAEPQALADAVGNAVPPALAADAVGHRRLRRAALRVAGHCSCGCRPRSWASCLRCRCPRRAAASCSRRSRASSVS